MPSTKPAFTTSKYPFEHPWSSFLFHRATMPFVVSFWSTCGFFFFSSHTSQWVWLQTFPWASEGEGFPRRITCCHNGRGLVRRTTCWREGGGLVWLKGEANLPYTSRTCRWASSEFLLRHMADLVEKTYVILTSKTFQCQLQFPWLSSFSEIPS
jgi:hypothetical protein